MNRDELVQKVGPDSWHERPGLPDRWFNSSGAQIIKERPLGETLEEALSARTTYALKLPGQIWRDVESFHTLDDAKAAAIRALKGDSK
jgi:hypothetical protein